MKLITPYSIIEAFKDSPAVVKTFVASTMLSPRWQDVMIHPCNLYSAYYWVRITRASLLKHINEDNKGEKMTITELRNITDILGSTIPELLNTSLRSGGDRILPVYESKYNKKETSDYIMFAVVNGHASQNTDYRVFKQIDVTNELCKQRQVGQRFSLIDGKPDLIASREGDIALLEHIDWEFVLRTKPVGRPRTKPAKKKSKNPVGRPRKQTSPFSKPPNKRRATLKSIMQQLNERTDALMSMIRPKRWVYDHTIIGSDNMGDIMDIMNNDPLWQDAEVLHMIQADKTTIVAYRTPAND